jgi:hypothetical protein
MLCAAGDPDPSPGPSPRGGGEEAPLPPWGRGVGGWGRGPDPSPTPPRGGGALLFSPSPPGGGVGGWGLAWICAESRTTSSVIVGWHRFSDRPSACSTNELVFTPKALYSRAQLASQGALEDSRPWALEFNPFRVKNKTHCIRTRSSSLRPSPAALRGEEKGDAHPPPRAEESGLGSRVIGRGRFSVGCLFPSLGTLRGRGVHARRSRSQTTRRTRGGRSG